MSELGRRSGSQILRTFLPQQTADLKGGIYRVTEWSGALRILVDQDVIRQRLLREIMPWRIRGTDNGMSADLHKGTRIDVVELDDQRGVAVERFPRIWLCRVCRRIGKDRAKACRCGAKSWGQLHFVGTHSCGAIVEPWIKRCIAHDDVRLVSPRSSKARDIHFICPECGVEVMKGLGFQRPCVCGQGNIQWNVHKARTVYVPRGAVLVNPPRPDRMNEMLAVGGSRRALSWVIEGMSAPTPMEMAGKPTRGSLIEGLIRQGVGQGFAEKMAALAEEESELAADGADEIVILGEAQRAEAESQAVDIAMALAESRISSASLAELPGMEQVLADRYKNQYPAALARAGLAAVDLVERFPILNIMYGYTRGETAPGTTKLVPFRDRRTGYRLHGALSDTEALFLRLEPCRVANWLFTRGHQLPGFSQGDTDQQRARLAILKAADIPPPGDEPDVPTVGSDLLVLVHSYSHRFIRQAAVFAGIDRDALAEYLLPLHLGFFVYAEARGDFVLGGLQSVFEADLDNLLDAVVHAEHRCALDPGCTRGVGACLACLHLGEPSCRHFNTYLNRGPLFGRGGYLRTHW